MIPHISRLAFCLLVLSAPASAQTTPTPGPAQAFTLDIRALCEADPTNPICRGGLQATCESDAGDKCVCGSGQTCEATETSCACFRSQTRADAAPAGIGGLTARRPEGPIAATLDVRCGADTYTISTGTDGGTCTATPPGSGGGGGGSCTDGGNSANLSCDTGCTSSSGSGSCTGP